MTFVHPLMLGGLLLAGIPILLHLIMQQKPKRLPFPAFRFLVQRHRSNQRSIRFRHLLLLLLRVLAIAALCIALARPKLGEQPIMVLLFDTSLSMDYRAAGPDQKGKGVTRLDEAKRRGLELLDQVPLDTQIAILDSGEDVGGNWLGLAAARERINSLRPQPANAPVTTRLEDAYRLFSELPTEANNRNRAAKLLYVFSDRTQACWDSSRLPTLTRLRDKLPEQTLQTLFVDVGVDSPEYLAVTDLELSRQLIAANDRIEIRAKLRGVGRDYDTEVLCSLDGDQGERKPVVIKDGQTQILSWERRGLTPGPHFVEVRLATDDDAMSFGTARSAVFEVSGARRVLIVADDPSDDGPALAWRTALEAGSGLRFDCDLLSPKKVLDLGIDQLDRYQVVCLYNVARPPQRLWARLVHFVEKGGGLLVLPGRDELIPDAYADAEALKLLPGTFDKRVEALSADGVDWDWEKANYRHPLFEPFEHWRRDPATDFVRFPRRAFNYWSVKPLSAKTLASYADASDGRLNRPAVLERDFDRDKVKGRVLLFTTPFDGRKPEWNNYLATVSSFYVVLAKLSVGYLAGDTAEANFNYLLTGATFKQGVLVPLPLQPRFPSYTLSRASKPHGPELAGATFLTTIPRPADANELRLNQSLRPGNYSVLGAADGRSWLTGFSLNVPPEEGLLTKTPATAIEPLFGAGSVLPVGQKVELREALRSRWRFRVVELFPWLLVLLVLLLTVENLLANKFYRRQPAGTEAEATGRPAPERIGSS